jgi:hypothetical protein
VFTKSLPEQISVRARITTRARRAAAVSIGDHSRPVSGVASEFGMDWRIAHEAFVASAEQVLPDTPPPVRVLGLDETRRGKGKYETDPVTGATTWVDRFDTSLVDLSGDGGLFAQVNGRNSAAVIAWLAEQDPQWKAGITHVLMNTSVTLRAGGPAGAAGRGRRRRRQVPSGRVREPGRDRLPTGTGLGAPRSAGPQD